MRLRNAMGLVPTQGRPLMANRSNCISPRTSNAAVAAGHPQLRELDQAYPLDDGSGTQVGQGAGLVRGEGERPQALSAPYRGCAGNAATRHSQGELLGSYVAEGQHDPEFLPTNANPCGLLVPKIERYWFHRAESASFAGA